jgi:hypothetical protein
MRVETSPAALPPLVSTFCSSLPSLLGPQIRDRRRGIPFVWNGFRKLGAYPSPRTQVHAASPVRTGVGVCRWRTGWQLNWCSIVTVSTTGLTAMSLVMAAPASANGGHGTDGSDSQTATSASHERADLSERSPDYSRHNGADDLPSPAADPSTSETLVPWEAGHDRCKKQKGNRRLLPWCTDPGAGWVGSTTLRVRPNAAAPPGMCDAIGFRPSLVCRRVGPIDSETMMIYAGADQAGLGDLPIAADGAIGECTRDC